MKNYLARIAFIVLGILLGALNIAAGWWALGSTDLNLPSIGGVPEYISASIGLWLLGSALDLDRKLDDAIESD